MQTPTSTDPLRIAIAGGGLAGSTLANALQKYAHLDVHIYESAAQFSERGAAVGIGINGQRALSEMGDDIRTALDRAGAVEMHSIRQCIASGENAGTIIHDRTRDHNALIVHRTAFLQELLKPIPQENMHVNKMLVKIEEISAGGIVLHFSDESQEYADILVGADGIHGFVRGYILGPDHLATNPRFAGWWDARALVPIEKAKKVLGEQYFKENRQYGWIGDGGFMMHDVLDNGNTVQCVAAALTKEDWDANNWKKPLGRKRLEEAFATWKDGPIANGMMELLLDTPEPLAYAEWDHIDAPTFSKGRVCMMGDSAHAMTPWQGSGASQAIEDAMVLAKLLGDVQSSFQLNAALRAYDSVRRPRSQAVVESSRVSGVIMCGKAPGIGLDLEKLGSSLISRWKFIHDLDLVEHQNEAIRVMNACF